MARGELPTQVSLTQAARVVGGMLAYEVRKGRREGERGEGTVSRCMHEKMK